MSHVHPISPHIIDVDPAAARVVAMGVARTWAVSFACGLGVESSNDGALGQKPGGGVLLGDLEGRSRPA